MIPQRLLPRQANTHPGPCIITHYKFPRTSLFHKCSDQKLVGSTLQTILTSGTEYGLPMVSVYKAEDGSGFHVRPWTVVPDSSSVSATICPGLILSIPGVFNEENDDSFYQPMHLSQSGQKMLFSTKVDQAVRLYLFHFNTLTLSEIGLPPSIDMGSVYGFHIDDHRGVIGLLDTSRKYFIIPLNT